MIIDIKLLKYRGIKEIEIRALGQTNVICGKNSSGKSTVLEALNDDMHNSQGATFSPLELTEALLSGIISISDIDKRRMAETYKGVLIDVLSKKEKWYQIDSTHISNELSIYHGNNGFLSSFNIGFFDYHGAVNRFFEQKLQPYRPILIPPKRQLNHQTTIQLGEHILPNGQGVINKLFFLKNQDLKSDNYITYRKIYKVFQDITGYSFNIIPDRDNSLTLLFFIGNQWRNANDCGLGLRDILIMITFILATDYTFYLIEEPESHLHADFQKRLLNFFKSVSDKQFLLSTHSNVFLDANSVDKIYYCILDNEIRVSDETPLSTIITALGYSVTENLTSDGLILTEGPKDIPVLQKILKWTGALDKFNIKLWPLGGDIMGDLDLSIFGNRENVFAIIDLDPGSNAARRKFVANCKGHKIKCFQLSRYAIENYFTLEAIRQVFPAQVASDLLSLKSNKPVDLQIGFKALGKTIKAKNLEIINKMNIKDLHGTDLLDFVLQITQQIENSRLMTQEG